MFMTAVSTIVDSIPCTENGIRGGTWYTLSPRCHNFDVCPGCYRGMLEPFSLAPFFQTVTYELSESRVCSFHPTSKNFLPYMFRLQEAVETGVWSRFSKFVRRQAILAPCPRSKLTPNLIWYGYQDCGICPACYEEVCAGTVLAPGMPVQAARVAGPTMCSMYSPRMRRLYAEACARGRADALVEFAHARALAHANTVLRADAMRQIRQMKMVQAAHQGVVGSMYSAGQSFSMAAGTTSAYAYGNSSLGWHPTQSGAMAAQSMQNMSTGMAEANSATGHMEIARLEAQWLEYE
jgi:hypothetical protein